MRLSGWIAPAIAAATLAAPEPTWAQPPAVGTEFQVNVYQTSYQRRPSVAANSGGFVISWESGGGQDGSTTGVFARRFTGTGSPQGADFRVNAYTFGYQGSSAVGMESDGDFVVAWLDTARDGSSWGLFARRFDSAGIPKGSDFQVNSYTPELQFSPEIAMAPDGRFVIVWLSRDADVGALGSVFLRRFDASGTPQASEFQVNTSTLLNQFPPYVAIGGDGAFVVTWEQDFNVVLARRFDSAGTPRGTELVVGAGAFPAVGVSTDGDFVVTWDGSDGSANGIFARRVSAAGVLQAAEFQVNTFTPGAQYDQRIAVDADGDFVVTWTSENQDGGAYGVFARRFDAMGFPDGGEFQVPSYTAGEEERSSIAATPGGDFVIAWHRQLDDTEVFARRFKVPKAFDIDGNGSGEPLTDGLLLLRYAFGFRGATLVAGAVAGNCVRCTQGPIESYIARLGALDQITASASFQVHTYTAGIQGYSTAAADADGDFVVAWQSSHDVDGAGVFARRFSSAGTPIAGEFQVNSYVTGNQYYAAVGMESNGDFVTVWQGVGVGDGSQTGIFAQRFNAAGLALASEFRVNTHTDNYQVVPAIGMDADGDFVVAWQSSSQDGSSRGIFARRFSSAGTAQASEFQVNSSTLGAQESPAVAMTAAGDFVVAWQSAHAGPEDHIFAKRFNAAGAAQASEFMVNTHTPTGQYTPAVAWKGGDFVVVWTSGGQDGYGYGIFGRRFSAAGAPLGPELQINFYTSAQESLPTVVIDSSGSFVVSWQTGLFFGYGVSARRFDATGVPQAAEFQVGEGANPQGVPALAIDGRGDLVAAWSEYGRDGDSDGVFARRFIRENDGDIDANGAIEPLTDGLLVLRYLFGFRGATLISGAVAPNCTRCTAIAIEAFIAAKV
jgi:hypothetical protein